MKILIVHHQMRLYGGAELVVVRLAHYLQKHGHKASILAASTASHLEYNGLDIITPPKEIPWRLWDGSLSSLRELYDVFTCLRKLCSEHAEDFDVINTHNFPTIWAAPNKKKIVWMCNEIPDLWHRENTLGFVNQLLNTGRLADRLIVRSKSPAAVVPDNQCAKRFRHRYGFYPEIIPYGIDGEFFSQGVNVERYEKFCVIQPAMISPSKGQLDVLGATRGMNAKVIFAGYQEPSHPYTKRLERCIKDNNLDAILPGHVSKEELRALYYMSHVAVFPGRGQGSWLGPFEALATGTPIVVSPNLSCSGLIRREGLGVVTNNIAEALRAIYNHYPEYRIQAARGREYVLRNLTWDNFGAKMMELMER